MKNVARLLRAHEDLLPNRFRAKGAISAGTVEGLNNEIRVVTTSSYGFCTYDAMESALITRSVDFLNRNQPADFAGEALFIVERGEVGVSNGRGRRGRTPLD
jgi:Transposase